MFLVCDVTDISRGLNEVWDLLGFEEVVVKGVHVNINSCGCSREETCPLPRVKNKGWWFNHSEH